MKFKTVSCAVILSAFCAEAHAQSETHDALAERYEAYLARHEGNARAGDERPASGWRNVSPEAVKARAMDARDLMRDVSAALPENDAERAVLLHLLSRDVEAARHDVARIPFVGDSGFFSGPLYAARTTTLRTREDAEAWIDRLEAVPAHFDQHIANMRRGIETGWTAYRDPLDTSMEQIAAVMSSPVKDTRLWAPFENLPESLSGDEAADIRARGEAAAEAALAAYRDLHAFFTETYAPAAREEPGIVSLPGGRAAYAAAVENHTAGAGYGPEDIHALGQQEVARIRAEMDAIIDETGFEGTFEEFLGDLRTNPRFYTDDPKDLIEKASEISKRLDAILPRYFGKLPRLPYGVEPVPADIAPGYTTGRYASGDPEKGVAGTYWVNTYALDQRPLYQLPALSAHEAVPGHHLQISLAQELEGRPDYRKQYYATAFGEGWGLYAEKLAGEAGIYETPYERFGQLSYEMWRACRLVADTGLHWYGWSRKEAEACFNDNTALAPLNIKTEVTRYIGWPGQAVAYKIGELKILELRARAKEALGADFDIRDFHDAVLEQGALPLDALERQIDDWIAREKSAAAVPR